MNFTTTVNVNRTKYHFQHDVEQFVQHELSNIWGE